MQSRATGGRLALLASLPVFASCSGRELEAVDRLVDDIDVSAGEVLVREGIPGRESFIVVAGEARVTINGREIALLGPGDFFGEMSILDPGQPRSATVTAASAMRLLVLDPRSFSTLITLPCVAHKVILGLIRRLRATEAASTSS
jgi:CRP-like cAMP-binding protein